MKWLVDLIRRWRARERKREREREREREKAEGEELIAGQYYIIVFHCTFNTI